MLFAWLLLGEVPTVMQLLGGVLILAGVALVGSTSSVPAHRIRPIRR